MKIRPFGDHILVKRASQEEKTAGGIIIPDTAKEKPIEGEVLAVGNGKELKSGKLRPLLVKPGDRILYSKYAGTEIRVGGEEHFLIEESDVLAVFDK
jgi:chaperonin GroES